MNRRTALFSSLFLGGLAPAALRAQEYKGQRVSRGVGFRSSFRDDEADAEGQEPALPPGLKGDGRLQLKRWDISGYTSIPTVVPGPPEKHLIDWILLRTGISAWHGDQPAVLSANRKYLLAYNSPEVMKQVDDIVQRFIDADADTLKVQVQFIAAVDPRWRYTVYPRMTYVGGGPQGQQIWTMTSNESALILAQMQVQQGFRQLAKEAIQIVNGQTVALTVHDGREFVGGLAPEAGRGVNFQPRRDKIEEAIALKLSPLLNYEGDAVDAKIDVTVNMIRTLHRTKVIAPRSEAGSIETAIDVPDATQTHLEQTVRNWRLGQSLVISCGIHPGILDKKSGLFNLPIPGTYPTATEVLVFLDIKTLERPRTARGRSRTARGRYDDADTEIQ